MNLILFEADEIGLPLSKSDPRARHLLEILRCTPGSRFDAGLINGPRGKGLLAAVDEHALRLEFDWGKPPPGLFPINLVVGMPRPQTARKILLEGTSLGVGAMAFFQSEKGEAGYGQSTLWKTGEWRRHLIAGAEQAFCTHLPGVRTGLTLAEALPQSARGHLLFALDNYEASASLGTLCLGAEAKAAEAVTIALGPERGWSQAERELLRSRGSRLAHLGDRVLRLETAVVASVALVRDLLFCGSRVPGS